MMRENKFEAPLLTLTQL
uniref:Uncharacterized protein n=1 Tax=Anguilla anguilla TaxID=7936 RepID=A0A0E9SUK6_ANGAN